MKKLQSLMMFLVALCLSCSSDEFFFGSFVDNEIHTLSGQVVVLSAENTGSPTFQWTQLSGPQTVEVEGDDTANPRIRFWQVGVYVFSVFTVGPAENLTVNVHDINGGENFALALKPDGTLLAWGRNSSGELGNPSVATSDEPIPVCDVGATDCDADPLTNVVAIATGRSHSLALKTDGTVWAWGSNSDGQIGDNTNSTRTNPVQVCDVGSSNCTTDPLTGVVAVTAGYLHSMALLANGTVVGWGRNNDGELGIDGGGDSLTPVYVCEPDGTGPCTVGNDNILGDVKLLSAGGGGHTLAVTNSGEVYGWGYNKSGQIGIGDSDINEVHVPEQVCAPGETAPCTQFLSGIIEIETWSGHSLALDENGALWGWGGNNNGELSMVTTTTCNSGNTCSEVPARVCESIDNPCTTPLTDVVSIVAGRRYSMALMEDGTIRSWGDNFFGQLGDGTMTPTTTEEIQVCAEGTTAPCATFLSGIGGITAGNFNSFALTLTGELFAWGDGADGALGNGDTDVEPVPVEVTGY